MWLERPYPIWPLPEDYEELSLDGQKQARLAVLHNQSTPFDLVVAWDFFRRCYLAGAGKLFYKNGFEESSDFHYEMIFDLGQYGRNAWAGSEESIFSAPPLLLSPSRKAFSVWLCPLLLSLLDLVT